MKSFLPNYLNSLTISPTSSIILGLCAEAKGRQGLWDKAKPEVLAVLKQQAIISSTESSNRIEGVEVSEARLAPLVTGKVEPRDRSEEEIVGYRNALHWIHTDYQKIAITPDSIRELHRIAQSGTVTDAGQWKTKNNEIIEIHPDGRASIRFTPPPPEVVPEMMNNLCLAYREASQNQRLPDLFLIVNFVFDFLCIHPFRDGNGRVSRLLTLLLLYQHEYQVGKYISIEKIIEDTKESYYESLRASSIGWHEGEHDLEPVWRYFLRTIKSAYEVLAARVKVGDLIQGGKTQLIRNTILRQIGHFTLSDIAAQEKGVSKALIKKVLQQMHKENLIQPGGSGRGAYWTKN